MNILCQNGKYSKIFILFFHKNFLLNRDAVVQKWFERTRGFTKQSKTNAVEQSPIVQIKEVKT